MISEEDDDNISPEDSVVDSDDEFEDQGSSDGEDVLQKQQEESDSDEEELLHHLESSARSWSVGRERTEQIKESLNTESGKLEQQLHVDDLSSDDEEAGGNTIGRVPLHWYDAYDHIGYSITGEKVMKEKRGDTIDNAIANKDDPSSSRTVYDMYNGKYVTLSERDIEVIRRLQAGAFAHPEHNDTPDYIDYYSSIIEDMPVSAAPESRRQFVSSKWEMMKVMKIVKAMKEGRYVFQNDKRMNKVAKPALFMIWNDTEDEVLADSKRHRYHLPAPKAPLPGHSESYNPPQEYLLTPEELKKWEEMDPSERERNFVPKKYSCLRHVPGYENAIKERFERCLDLYLCPRKLKRRLNIDPETLVPRLPKPRELRPFPNMLSLQFLGHTKRIRSLAVSPDGQYLVSGSDDGTVRLWEVDNSLCRETWVLDEPVVSVSWNPNSSHHLIAVAVGTRLVLISTGTGDDDSNEILDSFLSVTELQISSATTDETSKKDDSEILHSDSEEDQPAVKETDTGLKWTCIGSPATERIISKKKPLDESVGHKVGPRVYIDFGSAVSCIAWHYRGDYIAVVCPTAGSNAVSIHQVSKASTQYPFKKKSPGSVQAVQFHPSRPYLFVATQQHVKVYNLIEQKLVKRLLTGCKWISSLEVHQSGDHVLIGSYDRRVVWFDLDLSSTPYKTLKFHEKAVRDVKYHRRYPLMASAADDGTVHIFHSTVYSDLLKNPMIVPLKVLRGHGVKGGLGVLSIAFHPSQPWIFSAGADGIINLYQDVL